MFINSDEVHVYCYNSLKIDYPCPFYTQIKLDG